MASPIACEAPQTIVLKIAGTTFCGRPNAFCGSRIEDRLVAGRRADVVDRDALPRDGGEVERLVDERRAAVAQVEADLVSAVGGERGPLRVARAHDVGERRREDPEDLGHALGDAADVVHGEARVRGGEVGRDVVLELFDDRLGPRQRDAAARGVEVVLDERLRVESHLFRDVEARLDGAELHRRIERHPRRAPAATREERLDPHAAAADRDHVGAAHDRDRLHAVREEDAPRDEAVLDAEPARRLVDRHLDHADGVARGDARGAVERDQEAREVVVVAGALPQRLDRALVRAVIGLEVALVPHELVHRLGRAERGRQVDDLRRDDHVDRRVEVGARHRDAVRLDRRVDDRIVGAVLDARRREPLAQAPERRRGDALARRRGAPGLRCGGGRGGGEDGERHEKSACGHETNSLVMSDGDSRNAAKGGLGESLRGHLRLPGIGSGLDLSRGGV
jgi:hypothetical protein